MTKPTAVVRGSSLIRGFGRSSRNEKSERNNELHDSIRQQTDPYR